MSTTLIDYHQYSVDQIIKSFEILSNPVYLHRISENIGFVINVDSEILDNLSNLDEPNCMFNGIDNFHPIEHSFGLVETPEGNIRVISYSDPANSLRSLIILGNNEKSLLLAAMVLDVNKWR